MLAVGVTLLLLVALMLFLPIGQSPTSFFVVWLILALAVFLLLSLLLQSQPDERSASVRMLSSDEQPNDVRTAMDVRVAIDDGRVRVFRGPLRESPQRAFQRLRASRDMIPFLQQDEQLGTSILLMPRPVEARLLERKPRVWVNWLLFAATVVTTTMVGASYAGAPITQDPWAITAGLPYSLALLAILGVHELGHYFTALKHRLRVTPPYFIPVPFALGTFGAFIRMKSPPETRTAMFDVAIAGPLAGVAVAIPALALGLKSSGLVYPGGALAPEGLAFGAAVQSSFLMAWIADLAIGQPLPYGTVVQFSPLAFAGWLGLLVTALNLLPIGQLDGGHIVRGMLGYRGGELVSRFSMWLLLLVALFVWPGLLLWTLIVFLIAREGMPALNDITPISRARMALGVLSFLLLAAIVIPVPPSMWSLEGLRMPW